MQEQPYFHLYNASAGSGKTFTLVKDYIKILLTTNNDAAFQQILAITFTNKAANEMKERVMDNIRAMARGEKNDMADLICKETGLDPNSVQPKAQNILHAILQNYAAFNIVTIDTFTHRIVRSFAIELGLTNNFEIELEENLWINEAIEQVISKVGLDQDITKVLLDFALEQADQDRSWDVGRDLKDMAKILHNENDQPYLAGLQDKTVKDFLNFRNQLYKGLKEIAGEYERIGNEGLELIASAGLEHNDFFSSMLPKHFIQLRDDYKNLKFFETALKRRIENGETYSRNKPEKTRQKIEQILPKLEGLYYESENFYRCFLLQDLLLKSITSLAVLSEINKALSEIREENNIHFLSEFNQLIHKHLKEQPAAFIYEKIGEKFKYYFIDEMQDTSVLQWNNLIPLIDNALSSQEAGLLLVGDAKQSIYRWRGGRPEQFIQLADNDGGSEKAQNPFQTEKEVFNLDTNYRSYHEIIQFNNSFFSHIAPLFDHADHRTLYQIGNRQKNNALRGGFVQIEFLEGRLNNKIRDEIIPQKVVEIIENLRGKTVLNKICILVRKATQGAVIAKYLSGHGIQITSADSLLLKNDSKIDFLLNVMRYLSNFEDKNAKFDFLYFLHRHWNISMEKHDFIAGLINLEPLSLFEKLEDFGLKNSMFFRWNLSLYDMAEQIIRSFELISKTNVYVQSFLDLILQFSETRSQSLADFLVYWDEKSDKWSIPSIENSDAVQILTIHKAKGLEFEIVIVPYDLQVSETRNSDKVWYDLTDFADRDDFPWFYLPYKKELAYTGTEGEKIVQSHTEQQQLDNFNLIYVAFTRAIQQLYIIGEAEAKGDLKSMSGYLQDFLSKQGFLEEEKYLYTFGSDELIQGKKAEVKVLPWEPGRDFISTSWQEHDITIASTAISEGEFKQHEAISYGNLVHEILAKVISKNDVEPVFQQYLFRGILKKEQLEELKQLVYSIVENPALHMFYEPDNKVITERELINEGKEIFIPDRLVFEGNRVTVIDYKTGRQEEKYISQIEQYAKLLIAMGFEINKKIIIYLQEEICIIDL